ncbi:chorismate lyase [Hydrogenophilus islandicus]
MLNGVQGRLPAPWRAANATIPHPWRGWLRGRGSLTARIQSYCRNDFAVIPLRQERARMSCDEQQVLESHLPVAWVREVVLLADGVAVVFARSVLLPRARTAWPLFFCAGKRPLGALLFDDPAVCRGPLEAARIDPRHSLWRLATHYGLLGAAAPLSHTPLWARRSLFWREGQPLLVQELFLPAITRLDLRLGLGVATPQRPANPGSSDGASG